MDYTGVLVCLGNPGSKYEGTRHNTGFLFADRVLALAERNGTVSSLGGSKFSCELWRISLDAWKGNWLVAKPQTFMNLSGECVQPLLAWHRISPDSLVVVHDELDIPPGALRFKKGGGNAGHNGLKSITQMLGTPNFYRLRIGIGRPEHKDDVINWVLGRPYGEALDLWYEAEDAGIDVIAALAKKGQAAAEQTARDLTKKIAKAHADKAIK